MDELKLIERLRLIEALFAGAWTPGERVADERARERITCHRHGDGVVPTQASFSM